VVLATLALNAGRTVAVETLTEAIWSGSPPSSARNQVQTCVSQLRRQLATAGLPEQVIDTEAAGYRLESDRVEVDAHRFRALVAQARAAAADGRADDAREGYRAAVGLWRGAVLPGVDSNLVRELAGGLDAERVQALEECLEVELALGGGGELVAELTELVRRYPYRERLHAALMRALYRAGRTAEALAAFRHARRLFHDELGTEPGEELQRLHQAILNRDPDPGLARRPPAGRRPVQELPVEVSGFVGREPEIAWVRAALAPPDRPARRRPPVVVLYGPGGTGKSALAVRVAHELASEFPDGQLYVDLCGSTPGMRPLPPVEVLGRFLRRLGVHPSEVPSGVAEAAALFRSVAASRRLLLLLDNAADKDQVAGLIPGTPGCAVLVTSRHPLSTLDIDERRRVGALPDGDGLALLTGLTGRLATEPEAARQIVALCGGLPLAIRVAAGRLAGRPDLTGAEYARRLADRSRRLDELQLDDLAVRASIRTSYDALLADGEPVGWLAARAFRMLGLLHVPDVAPPVVAAMLATPAETARAALDRLVDAQLVEPVAGGRYRLHDLVRLVAAERAHNEEPEAHRRRAAEHAVYYYTGALRQAERMLRPTRTVPFGHPRVPDRVGVPTFADPSEARRWIDAELRNLVSALELALSLPTTVPQPSLWLADAIWMSLNVRCEWQLAHHVSQLVMNAAEGSSDHDLVACGLLLGGRSEACTGNLDLAVDLLERALELVRALDNQPGIALVLNGLGVTEQRRAATNVALTRFKEALEVGRQHGLTNLVASVLGNLSASYVCVGLLDRAVDAAEQSVEVVTAEKDLGIRASATLNLAAALCLWGKHAEAVRHADHVAALGREAGDRLSECEGLIIRAEANRRRGRLGEALVDVERALSAVEENGYRYGVAAALRQRSKVLTAQGRVVEAESCDVLAAKAFGQLTGAFRDPTIEIVIR
jgi:DNA-binding SARP family transcriptional activator